MLAKATVEVLLTDTTSTEQERTVTRKKKAILLLAAGALMVSQLYPLEGAEAKSVMVDSQVLEQLQRLVADQQKQLDKLQHQVNEFQTTALQAQVQAKEAKVAAEEAKTSAETPASKLVTSGSERVKLAVSGQINRAVNLVGDGDETALHFVDNDASNTRIRFVGTAQMTEDLTLGSRLEVALAPNLSSEVSQDTSAQDAGDFIDERYADLSFASKRYGKLYLGKGDTASNSTAEVDLSGTDVVQYASYGAIAGGIKFRNSADDTLSGVTVSQAFNNFDGLSRKSRLRYDTPTFYGFGLAGSAVTDSRWDTALTWSGSGNGFKAGAAIAVAALNTDPSDYQYDGSFSVLHEETGVNLTVSSGTKDFDGRDDANNLWGKIGWQANLCPLGETSFGIDYGHTENQSAQDDEGDSFGIAMVQSLAEYGTELYLQIRQYSLDREAGVDFSDINMGTIGARVKF